MEASDTSASSQVDDHRFDPKPDEPWGLCRECGLSRAAHQSGPIYEPPASSVRAVPESS